MSTTRREEVRHLNLVDLLRFEHEQQRALLAELNAASDERGAVSFRQLARLLATHESAEEIVLYPVVRANFDDGDRLARLATEQEAAIKKALANLQTGDLARADRPSTSLVRTGLQEVEELVYAHHELEERQILASLPDFEDAAALGGLASAYKIAVHLTPTRGHRRAPTGPMSNVLLGTPLGILDRLRGLKDRNPES
jgi:hemerythrin superfamily protein